MITIINIHKIINFLNIKDDVYLSVRRTKMSGYSYL